MEGLKELQAYLQRDEVAIRIGLGTGADEFTVDGADPFPDTGATDMVWRIEGHSIASKEYATKHEYLEEFVKPFGARFLASERFRPTNIRSVHADGNTVIVGEVVDMTALTDSISLNELLERVQPAAQAKVAVHRARLGAPSAAEVGGCAYQSRGITRARSD